MILRPTSSAVHKTVWCGLFCSPCWRHPFGFCV